MSRLTVALVCAALAAPSAALCDADLVLGHLKFSDTESVPFPVGELDDEDLFGNSIDFLPDLNGNGVPEMVVGSLQDSDGGFHTGAVWLLFLNESAGTDSVLKIANGEGGLAPDEIPVEALFGTSVSHIGDLDGDGFPELAVGAQGVSDGGFRRGAAWILFLNGDGSVRDAERISDTQGSFEGELDDIDSFGAAVAGLGDLNGDEIPDLAVGANGDDDGCVGGDQPGAVWILFLTAEGTVNNYAKVSNTALAGQLDCNDLFGTSVASLGDLDGDGTLEIAVGAQFDSDTGAPRGAVWIVSLNSDGTVERSRKINQVVGGFDGDVQDGDDFGRSVSSASDLDGDAVNELVVGALGNDDGGGEDSNRGAVYVLLMRSDGTVKRTCKISDTAGGFDGVLDDGDLFGVSVAGTSDLDGDGRPDLIVGAHRDDDGGDDRGALWLLSLTDLEPPIETEACFQTVQFDFVVQNSSSTSEADRLLISKPRAIVAGVDPDSLVLVSSCGVEDESPILPPVPPGEWCRLASSREAWWFFPEVLPQEFAPSMTVSFTVPVGAEPDSVGDLNIAYEVDFVVMAGTDTLDSGVYSFSCMPTVPLGVDEGPIQTLSRRLLGPNVPNPFNPRTRIQFSVPRDGAVDLSIYNASGQHLVTLVRGRMESGSHQVEWDGTDKSGRALPSGVYFSRISVEGDADSQSMILLK